MRLPTAEWRGPVPGMGPGGLSHPATGVVMHIMGASMAAADAWFHNPSSRVSAHFGIGLGGHLVQWVDTDDRAWHAGAANPHYYGVETEGSAGPLTPAQLRTFAELYRVLEARDHFGFQLALRPGDAGLGWHGMGGTAWGGHPYCPGEPRKAQRGEILQLAAGHVPAPQPPQQEEDDVPPFIIATDPGHTQKQLAEVNGRLVALTDGADVTAWLNAGAKPIHQAPATFDIWDRLAEQETAK